MMKRAYLITLIAVFDQKKISICMTDPNFVSSGRSWVLFLFLSIVYVTPMSLIGSMSVVDILTVFWEVCWSFSKML